MKLIIIGIPEGIPEEVIHAAVTAFAFTVNSDVHAEELDTNVFKEIKKQETSEVKVVTDALEEIVKTCISCGTSLPNVTANFWRLIHDGKISPPRVRLLKKYPHIVRSVCEKYNCPSIMSQINAAEQYLP